MKSNCAFHIHAFYLASSVEIKKARRGEILNIWLHDMNLIKMWHYKLGFCLFLPQQKLQPPRSNHQNVANRHIPSWLCRNCNTKCKPILFIIVTALNVMKAPINVVHCQLHLRCWSAMNVQDIFFQSQISVKKSHCWKVKSKKCHFSIVPFNLEFLRNLKHHIPLLLSIK